jgi:DNA-3-methyladenine glycosylase II
MPEKSQFDPEEAVAFLCDCDPKLKALIKKVGPFTMRPERAWTPHSALSRSIVYQQLSGKAAATILSRVHALYPGSKKLDPEEIIKTPDERFRGAGLSAAKTAALKDLSRKAIEGIVPERKTMMRMESEEIIERLIQVRGIGQWTVEMMLIFYMGRMDILPATDYGVRKGFALTYKKRELPHPKQLLKFGERWRPYRSVASWYMWRALD